MVTVSLKGLWARRRRTLGTVFAVFLGVALLMGTLTLGSTLQRNFTNLFTRADAGTDVVVQSRSDVAPRTPALIPASILSDVRGVPGVADAQPVVSGSVLLEGSDGKVVGGLGAPRLGQNWVADPALNPYRLVAGRAPQLPTEVVVNKGAATSGKLPLGTTTVVLVPNPVRVTVVGIATFGTAPGFGSATFVGFTLQGAEAYLRHGGDALSSVAVRGEGGISQAALVARVGAVLPPGVEAITGAQLSSRNLSSVDAQFVDVLKVFLLVFAGIALVVATLSINNTLSILVAQRDRESALLRAIGATRTQALWGVVAEALAIGAVASALGLAAGIGMAGLLKGMFDAFGFALPAGGLVLSPANAAVSLGTGLAVTLVAALAPAVRASRTRPVSALRASSLPAVGVARRTALGGLLVAAGAAVVVTAASGAALGRAGLGAVAVLAGVVILGPVVARPAAGAVGAVAPGAGGLLGRRNAQRDPRRTAATAAPLLVGVAVVTLFTAFAASLRTSVESGVRQSVRADLVITSPGYGGQVSPTLGTALRSTPGVAAVGDVGTGRAVVGGHAVAVSVLDPPTVGPLLDVGPGVAEALQRGSLAVAAKTAASHGWRVGTPVSVVFPDGSIARVDVGTTYPASDVVDEVVVPSAVWAPHDPQAADAMLLVDLRPGASTAGVISVARQIGSPTVDTRAAYAASAGSGVKTLLGIVYVMLALAVVISLLGIANTLSLSAYERARELGLLRAVGQTRRQLRAMMRWESVTVALLGAFGGLAIGVFLGWALVRAAEHAAGFFGAISRFSVPVNQLAIILAAGVLVGVIAAWRPARRAAGAPVLAALRAE